MLTNKINNCIQLHICLQFSSYFLKGFLYLSQINYRVYKPFPNVCLRPQTFPGVFLRPQTFPNVCLRPQLIYMVLVRYLVDLPSPSVRLILMRKIGSEPNMGLMQRIRR